MLRALLRPLGPLIEHERLLMISISTVLVMLGQGVVTPVLPLYAMQFGVSVAAVGLTFSMFALARMFLNVPAGILSERYGRRVLLISGPLIIFAGMVGSGLAQNFAELLAWRFVAGAGSALYMTGAQIYLADISNEHNRARFMGTNQGALLLGVSLGPVVGGFTAEAFGLRAPFFLVGAAALIATVYAYLRLPETRGLSQATTPTPAEDAAAPASPAATHEADRAWLRMMRSPSFIAVSVVTMAIFFTRAASRQNLLPLLAADRFGLSAGDLGVLFTSVSLINLVLIIPAAWLADRYGRKWAIVPSGFVVAAGLLLLAGAQSVLMLWVASTVLAAGTALSGPAPAAYVADIAPVNARGFAMGLYRTTGDVGFVVGPPLLGLIVGVSSFAWGLSVNAALITFAVLFFLVVARNTGGAPPVRRPAPPAAAGTATER